MLAPVVGFLAVQVVGSLLTKSLALLADAGHMLTDAVGVGMALLAIHFAARPATATKSFGYYRLEILAAVANAMLLFGVAAYIPFEAYQRFAEPPQVLSLPMLGVAAIGLVVNLISMRLLSAGAQASLNLRGAYLEVLELTRFGGVPESWCCWRQKGVPNAEDPSTLSTRVPN